MNFLNKAKELKAKFEQAQQDGTLDLVKESAKGIVNQVKEEGLDGPTAQAIKAAVVAKIQGPKK